MQEKNLQEVYLIDASIYIFKYYFSLPDNWWSEEDYPTAAVYGYTHWLFRFLNDTKAQYVAACFDESLETCFRNQLYPDYKSSRALPDEALAYQLQACKTITELLGIPVYASEEYEADDLLGTLAVRCRKKGMKINVLSRDKDLSQLIVNAHEYLWDYPDGLRLDLAGVKEKVGVSASLVADYLAIVGDVGDDIPGVPGVGPKSAAAVLNALGPWAAIKKNFDKVASLPVRGALTLASKLAEYEKQIDLALRLSTIVCAAPLGRRYSVQRRVLQAQKLKYFGRYLGFGKGFETSVDKLLRELNCSVKSLYI